ncbi:polyadenylate-binding protein-interacting protein 2B [Anthonomus grandis grandis]|uniref:polyadenylate-binding protein-interacting protein 2B n=1 Tax=Anthonomus grandis grandis TaxID=2921223 RepID=UPI002166030C|nr:polyadenylate-binding protein-interacting protein 2B [Anthonomus grandis grandis]
MSENDRKDTASFEAVTAPIQAVMKMPPSVDQCSDSGIYEYENALTVNEELENTADQELNSPPEDDFSEYLWMENEEEFDKEVMQRLEEEALMEECIAFMSNENSNSGSENAGNVTNSKLNPEAAEFIPATHREPPLEGIPVTRQS